MKKDISFLRLKYFVKSTGFCVHKKYKSFFLNKKSILTYTTISIPPPISFTTSTSPTISSSPISSFSYSSSKSPSGSLTSSLTSSLTNSPSSSPSSSFRGSGSGNYNHALNISDVGNFEIKNLKSFKNIKSLKGTKNFKNIKSVKGIKKGDVFKEVKNGNEVKRIRGVTEVKEIKEAKLKRDTEEESGVNDDEVDVYLLNGKIQHVLKKKKVKLSHKINELSQKKKVAEQFKNAKSSRNIGSDENGDNNYYNHNNNNNNNSLSHRKYEDQVKTPSLNTSINYAAQSLKENNKNIIDETKERETNNILNNQWTGNNTQITKIDKISNESLEYKESKKGKENKKKISIEQEQEQEKEREKENVQKAHDIDTRNNECNENIQNKKQEINAINKYDKNDSSPKKPVITLDLEENEKVLKPLEEKSQQDTEEGHKRESTDVFDKMKTERKEKTYKEKQKETAIKGQNQAEKEVEKNMEKEIPNEREIDIDKVEKRETEKKAKKKEDEEKEKQDNSTSDGKKVKEKIQDVPPGKKEKKQNIKTDIYDFLHEINSETDKKEIENFLNYLLLYKNNDSVRILGNAISFYFCNLLSEDLKELKTYYYDGVKLSVNSFFSTLRDLDNSQLVKMTNVYLSDYFSKIFQILKSNNINLCFDNLQINKIKLLQIHSVLGLIRNEGKRKKQDSVKKFLYQHICIQEKHMEFLKNNNKMKFLTSVLQDGAIIRMHFLINVNFDLSSLNAITSNVITKTKMKNIDFEFIFENELTNPCFSLQPNETINLKAGGWYLVDVNQMLNGNLPYEQKNTKL